MIRRLFIVTLFPEYFDALKACGVVGAALRGERKVDGFEIEMHFINPRNFSTTNYKGVDDSPYGGGPGMVMRADILSAALIEGICKKHQCDLDELHVIYPCPRGKIWNDKLAREMGNTYFNIKEEKDLVFICGRYEGIDERFLEKYVHEFISIGDYILSGGEIAVFSILDSALRFSPGVLGNRKSHEQDSFSNNLIEHPQYTRPAEFEGIKVPAILSGGHHAKIQAYQKEESLRLTKEYRPDLLDQFNKGKK
ncbi:MAG: tRNA (guanine37-N1)-methyltransferase [Thermoproteota archaeon]|jgi:tRNA (guanine37-N1)-methyltransferase